MNRKIIELFDKMNDEQMKAIKSRGYVSVIAGAGSGKTSVLTGRIMDLVYNDNIPQEDILAVTFTNKATNEMANRIIDMISHNNVNIMTIHKYMLRLLRDNGVTRDILLPYDVTAEQRKIYSSMEEDHEDMSEPYWSCVKFVSERKRETNDRFSQTKDYKQIFFNLYMDYLDANDLMDFDDVLIYGYEMLNRPSVLKIEQEKYKYILVDEFQDINKIQFEILKSLSQESGELFVVGDPRQSIYGFRGTTDEYQRDFCTLFNNAEEIVLTKNYRSSDDIVNLTNYVMQDYGDTTSDRGELGEVTIKTHSSHTSEYMDICEKIKDIGDYKNTCILARTNNILSDVEIQLLKYDIPYYKVGGGQSMYEKAYRDLISISKLLLKDTKMNRSRIETMTKNRNLFDDYDNLDQYWISDRVHKDSFVDILYEFISDFDIYNQSFADFEYISNISDILDHVKSQELFSVKTFIEDYDLMQEKKAQQDLNDGDFVTLTTIHSAKGLEWDNVFVCSVDRNVLPFKKMDKHKSHLEFMEEENKIFYVALTRAKDGLYVSGQRGSGGVASSIFLENAKQHMEDINARK